ncbi:hypothetical protein [Mesorhizobium sp. B2-3-4]|uniref:hypothetical protein n=1 Tax=Mesorhizobium sp. B2-3-4 TaxID=2589959 RepID=UPI00112726EE|nr:hypothetical protein [Mesorhizobium sp. B2-3-4]TPM25694.1 hypothetical protein FJ967_32215 [Mesorhizobium sp. B2-3-4]
MGNIVAFRAKRQSDPQFGVCPMCRLHDGFVNKGSQHWFKCDKHRIRWLAGINLFDHWRDENRADQMRRFAAIECFEVVEPLWVGSRRDPGPKGAA